MTELSQEQLAAKQAQEEQTAKYRQQNQANDPIILSYPFKNGEGIEVTTIPSPTRLKVKDNRRAQKAANGCPIDAELYTLAAAYEMTFEDLGEVDDFDFDVLRERFLVARTTPAQAKSNSKNVEPNS